MARRADLRPHVVFLEDYDMNIARQMIQGVDVWLNNPRRPLEASGTSGMKVCVNGGLNLSVLDGWWVEGYQQDNGWAIGAGEEYGDLTYQDQVESRAIYDLARAGHRADILYPRGRRRAARLAEADETVDQHKRAVFQHQSHGAAIRRDRAIGRRPSGTCG